MFPLLDCNTSMLLGVKRKRRSALARLDADRAWLVVVVVVIVVFVHTSERVLTAWGRVRYGVQGFSFHWRTDRLSLRLKVGVEVEGWHRGKTPPHRRGVGYSLCHTTTGDGYVLFAQEASRLLSCLVLSCFVC